MLIPLLEVTWDAHSVAELRTTWVCIYVCNHTLAV